MHAAGKFDEKRVQKLENDLENDCQEENADLDADICVPAFLFLLLFLSFVGLISFVALSRKGQESAFKLGFRVPHQELSFDLHEMFRSFSMAMFDLSAGTLPDQEKARLEELLYTNDVALKKALFTDSKKGSYYKVVLNVLDEMTKFTKQQTCLESVQAAHAGMKSIQAQEYDIVAKKAELWMNKVEAQLFRDYGENENSAKALLEKYESLLCNLKVFTFNITALRNQAENCWKEEIFCSVVLVDEGFVPADFVEEKEFGPSASKHVESEGVSIMARQTQIESQFQSLMKFTRERYRKMSYKAYVLSHESVQFNNGQDLHPKQKDLQLRFAASLGKEETRDD